MSNEPQELQLVRSSLAIGPNAALILGEATNVDMSPEDIAKVTRVGDTLKAYRAAVRALLDGKYAALRPEAPAFITDDCCMKTFILTDGIILRRDLKIDAGQLSFIGIVDGTLESLAPMLSGGFVHCPINPEGYDPGEAGVTLTLSSAPVDTPHQKQDLMAQRVYAVVDRSAGLEAQGRLLHRPVRLIGLRNDFDLQLAGELAPTTHGAVHPFLMRGRFRLPFEWQTFEVFPAYDPEVWDPGLAPMWAEADLLTSVIERNLTDARWRALDPLFETRRAVARMLSDFKAILDGPEEPIHQFIKQHPQLLMPTQVQSWSKLPLGARKTDFVLCDASGEYLLVELEKATHRLFGKEGQPLAELLHAIDQIVDWKRYLADNLATVQRELKLPGISTNPRGLVVIGRSPGLTEDNRRKLTAMENESPRLKILTYDDLLANATATYENILGPVWDPGPNAEIYFLPPNTPR